MASSVAFPFTARLRFALEWCSGFVLLFIYIQYIHTMVPREMAGGDLMFNCNWSYPPSRLLHLVQGSLS